jgi:hypothetical protein
MAEIVKRAGQKPLSSKPKTTPRLLLDDIFGNTLGVDPEIKKALDAKGFAIRWINAADLQAKAGYHPRGWRPVKLKECGTIPSNPQDFMYGSDPEGYIRRGELILGVRSKELNDKHKAYLEQAAAARAVTASSKAAAAELRKYASEAGVDMKIQEGFEENE